MRNRHVVDAAKTTPGVGVATQLYSDHQVEQCYREPGIHGGYRATNLSLGQCLATLAPWNVNNETANVWTHTAACVVFLGRFLHMSRQMDFDGDRYTWPLYFYMITACTYPLMSASAHAFSALSPAAQKIGYFLDYTALALYSFGSAILYRAYVIPDRLMASVFAQVFLYAAVVNSVVCTTASCWSRFVADGVWQKALRLGSFAAPFCWDTAPLLLRLAPCWRRLASPDSTSCSPADVHHSGQVVAALLAAALYATHLPERIWPGRFDYVFNSHTWLHLLGIAATTFQMNAVLIDMKDRRATLERQGWTLTGFWSGETAMIVLILSFNLAVVAFFSLRVLRSGEAARKKNIVAS